MQTDSLAYALMLPRVLETEAMDTLEEALDYDAMDHAQVNRAFVADLLAARPSEKEPFRTRHAPRDAFPLAEREEYALREILDLGTGTALIPIELCRQWPAARVRAADAAEHMLAVAQQNVERAGLAARIRLEHVDAKRLPYADGQFATVISNSIVHHIPEPGSVLREAWRVTAAGGLLFFRDLFRPDDEATLSHLVATYAAGTNEHQRQMFADSLRAALTVEEVRALVAPLGAGPQTVQATSDRHWTWVAGKGSVLRF